MIFIAQPELERMMPMRDAIAIMEKGLVEYSPSDWDIPRRSALPFTTVPRSTLLMPVYSQRRQRIYTKTVLVHTGATHHGSRTSAMCTVWDAPSGKPLLACDGTYLTALRTAAAAGVAARFMARRSSRVALLIGSGYQGRYQLDAIASIFPLEKAIISNRSPEQAEELRRWGSERWKTDVSVQALSREIVHEADIVLAATSALKPVFDGHDLKPGTHVSSIGSYRPDMHEVDEFTLRSGRIVVDSMGRTPAESGDLISSVAQGAKILGDLTWLVRNPRLARQSDSDITVYKSAGFGLLDALLLEAVFQLSGQRDRLAEDDGKGLTGLLPS